MENIRENQIEEVLPYQYEPEVGGKGTNIRDQATRTERAIRSPRAKKSIKSLKQQMHGAFKLLAGVNVDIALYQKN